MRACPSEPSEWFRNWWWWITHHWPSSKRSPLELFVGPVILVLLSLSCPSLQVTFPKFRSLLIFNGPQVSSWLSLKLRESITWWYNSIISSVCLQIVIGLEQLWVNQSAMYVTSFLFILWSLWKHLMLHTPKAKYVCIGSATWVRQTWCLALLGNPFFLIPRQPETSGRVSCGFPNVLM